MSLGTGPDPLGAERAAALAQIAALTREFEEVVAASRASNADDEHDPEGATIAFERQQVVALLEQARRRLADVETAVRAVEAGTYGIDRKSTRLNSSHANISYAVFCLKKK